jgi:hypothetical protein
MKCSSLLLHRGQANVRKCWLHMLGSITANLMGESQATHCGPWFCLSSMRYPYVGPGDIHFIEWVSVTILST